MVLFIYNHYGGGGTDFFVTINSEYAIQKCSKKNRWLYQPQQQQKSTANLPFISKVDRRKVLFLTSINPAHTLPGRTVVG